MAHCDLTPNDLVSEQVRDEIGEALMVTAACLVVEYIDEDGAPALATFHEGSTFYAREGMARVLVRDITSMPLEYERRRARRRADDEGEC